MNIDCTPVDPYVPTVKPADPQGTDELWWLKAPKIINYWATACETDSDCHIYNPSFYCAKTIWSGQTDYFCLDKQECTYGSSGSIVECKGFILDWSDPNIPPTPGKSDVLTGDEKAN